MAHLLIGTCPICSEKLEVTRLECHNCGTEIGGHFAIGRLSRLNPDDIGFIETFVKNRGNAYRVADEMEISYSAVRSRLTLIIEALGFDTESEPKEESGISPEQRKQILDDLASGKLTSESAVKLLQGAA